MKPYPWLSLILICFSGPAFAEAPIAPPPASVSPPEGNFMKIDNGQVKFNALLQPWYIDQPSSGSSVAKNNFRIRRAEIRFGGNLSPETRWFVMADPAKALTIKEGSLSSSNDNKVLQDLGVAWMVADGWEWLAGQVKTPTTAEGLDSSGDLPLPERSLIGRTLGDKRLIGIQTSYRDTANKDAKWKFTGMLSNGSNANTDDSTNGKDLNLRGDFLPFSGFSMGGWFGMPDTSIRNFPDNHRWGFNLRWKGEKEYVRYEHGQSKSTIDGEAKKFHGHTAEVGYLVWPKVQPVLRFERFYPSSSKSAHARAVTLGFNYYLFAGKSNQKLQMSYSVTKGMGGSNGSISSNPEAGSGRVIVICFQMAI